MDSKLFPEKYIGKDPEPTQIYWGVKWAQCYKSGYSEGINANFSVLGENTDFIQGWVKGIRDSGNGLERGVKPKLPWWLN